MNQYTIGKKDNKIYPIHNLIRAYLIFPSTWSEQDCRHYTCINYDVTWIRAGDMLCRTKFGFNWYIYI